MPLSKLLTLEQWVDLNIPKYPSPQVSHEGYVTHVSAPRPAPSTGQDAVVKAASAEQPLDLVPDTSHNPLPIPG